MPPEWPDTSMAVKVHPGNHEPSMEDAESALHNVSCKKIISTGFVSKSHFRAAFFSGLANPRQLKDKMIMEGDGGGYLVL